MTNNILDKKIAKSLVAPQINNKLLVRYSKNKINMQLSNNFKINNARDFKLMKNIIGMELLLGQRPLIVASLIKKSLVINLKITSPALVSWLKFLQKKPIPWNYYLQNFNLFDHYNIPTLVVKNLKFNLTLKTRKISKLDNWIKSAYLD